MSYGIIFGLITDLKNQTDLNYHLICSCLSRLSNSTKKIIWSQGGFDHPSFNGSVSWDFSQWQETRINLNLWDHMDDAKSNQHITNPDTHRLIAEQIMSAYV